MTFVSMTPTWINVYENAIIPYQNKEISQEVAFQNGIKPFRTFMLKYTRQQDLALFIEFSKIPGSNKHPRSSNLRTHSSIYDIRVKNSISNWVYAIYSFHCH